MEKESKTCFPAGHWSLDLVSGVSTPHECPIAGGAVGYSLQMEREGRWPPPAPVFRVGGTELIRRFARHIWLECDAGIGVNIVLEADAGIGKSGFILLMAMLDMPTVELSRILLYRRQTLMDALYDATRPNESLFGDEALTELMFGLDSHDPEQRKLWKVIWEFARFNKKKLWLAAQDSKSLARIARSGLARYWIVLDKRSSATGQKRGLILHGVRSPKWDKKARGYEMERPFRYRVFGRFIAPGVSAKAMEKYHATRSAGLGQDVEKIDYAIDG